MLNYRSASIFCTLVIAIQGLFGFAQNFENLKVLPKDISKKQMTQTMKAFSRSLGVRCDFCHVGEPGAPLSSFDFASDEKETKQITRKMMEMVGHINGTALKDLEGPGKSGHVSCYTCHRGVPDPTPLDQVLAKQFKKNGLEATINRYNELRSQFYGEDAYNFGPGTLFKVAEDLAGQNHADAAISVLNLNLEHYADSGYSHFLLGDLYSQKGDTVHAEQHFKKAIELMPNWPEPKKRLEQLKSSN